MYYTHMRKRVYLIILLFFILVVTGVILRFTPLLQKKVHYHAGILVVKDNQQVNLGDWKYMHIKPCTIGKQPLFESPRELQLEKAHLHDGIGDVVHSHREGGTWKDFFTNIDYPLEYTQTKAYLNGQSVSEFQKRVIQPYDSLVVFIGENASESAFLAQAVPRTHIEQVEKRSESCGGE